MALAVPTIEEINTNIVAQLESSLSQTIPLLPKAFTRVLAKALAAVFILIYKYAGFIFLQIFVEFAQNKDTIINGRVVNPLVAWGELIGVGKPAAAVQSELVISVNVITQTGALAAGLQVLRTETGVLYLTKSAVALDASMISMTIVASSDEAGGDGSGAQGNLADGDVVSFANPIAQIERDAVVASIAVTGANAESTDNYRKRIIGKFQARPQGGAYADYREWATEVTGIINAYPFTSHSDIPPDAVVSLPGEVDVYIEATEESSGSPDGIPTGTQLQEARDSIELDENGKANRRPATAAVNVLPIIRTAFDVTIKGLDVLDEASTQDSIKIGLEQHLRTRESFIVGLSVLPRNDRVTLAAIGGIVDGIVNAAGGSVGKIELFDSDANSVINFTVAPGEKTKIGTVTYI